MRATPGCLPDGRTMGLHNVDEWPLQDQLPVAVLTRTEHARLVADVGAHGVACHVCDIAGTDVDTDDYLAYLAREVEPVPWHCGCCEDCHDGSVHEPGTADCPWEVGA